MNHRILLIAMFFAEDRFAAVIAADL